MLSIETKHSAVKTRPGDKVVYTALRKKITCRSSRKTLMMVLIGSFLLVIAINFYAIRPSYYRSPLAVSPEVAGTFGEVRKDHFHLGLDIRTGGKENLPVYAMADGYIYRVSIQADGYGKAIYIAYRNGMMSLYGHLNSFSDEVEIAIHEQQKLSESWEQEMFFTARRFPVKKGMLVGYSGNTGSSEGPHLHVEFRDMKKKTIINPISAGLSIADHYKPSIHSIFVYNGSRSLYESRGREISSTTQKRGDHAYTNIIDVGDSLIRIGIEANDRNDQPKFYLGIYQAQLFLDERLQFEFTMDSIPIAKDRYVNASIDYAQLIQNNRCIQLLSVLPGNHLPAYNQLPGNGILHLTKGRVHQVKIVAKDASGNSTSVNFKIRYKPAMNQGISTNTKLLLPGVAHKASSRNAIIYFSPLAFYDAVPFTIDELSLKSAGSASPVIRVYDPLVPVHTPYRMQLKTTLSKNDPSRKYVLMELTSRKDKWFIKGGWKGDYVDGTFDKFGNIRLIIDKVPPNISLFKSKGGTVKQRAILQLRVKDNCGPVESFTARLDGIWVPFEQKKDLFYYRMDEKFSKGKHSLAVEATDKAGNRKQEIINIYIGE